MVMTPIMTSLKEGGDHGWLAKTNLEFDVKLSGFIVTAPDLVRL